MPLGARTWYPAQDERNGLYQLQKAEERAALEHAEKLRRIERTREIRLRRESCHDTPCGSERNFFPRFFVPGGEHHHFCNANDGKALDSGSLPNPGTFMPVAQQGAQGYEREGHMLNQKDQSKLFAKHENSMQGPTRGQKKNEQAQNQGSTLSTQNRNTQNSNHQKQFNQHAFGNEQSGKQSQFSKQPNDHQNSSGVGKDNRQKIFRN